MPALIKFFVVAVLLGILVLSSPLSSFANGTCVATATGSGTACFTIIGGGVFPYAIFTVGPNAQSVSGIPVPPPAGLFFPHGLFSFKIIGDCSNLGTVQVEITLPSAMPVGTQYWKYGPTPTDLTDHWYVLPMGSDDGDSIITISLVDGGLGDDMLPPESEPDCVIVDQGGPGNPAPAPVGGFIEPVNKLNVFTPYLALLGVIAAVAVVLTWKKPEN